MNVAMNALPGCLCSRSVYMLATHHPLNPFFFDSIFGWAKNRDQNKTYSRAAF